MKKLNLAIAMFIVLFVTASHAGEALLIEYTALNPVPNNRNYGASNYTFGTDLIVGSSDINVTSLGYEDIGQDGLAASHRVGLWDASGTLLASVTVSAGVVDPLVGTWRFAPLDIPLVLIAGHTYYIGGEILGDNLTHALDSIGLPSPFSFSAVATFGSFGASYNIDTFSVPDTDGASGKLAWIPANLLYEVEDIPVEGIPGDIDGNFIVNLADLKLFAEQWLDIRDSFIESDGRIVIEAENYMENSPGTDVTWVAKDIAGSIGDGCVQALPDNGEEIDSNISATSPHLTYEIDFAASGTYYLWVRGIADNTQGDSIHYGIDGVVVSTGEADSIQVNSGSLEWSNGSGGAIASIEVPSAGLHSLDVWMREDGVIIDRLLLSTDSAYVPIQPSATGFGDRLTANINRIDGVDMSDFALISQNWQNTDSPIIINEFVTSNSSTISHSGNRLDEFGNDVDEFDDWIEIYNRSTLTIDIGGMYLTDKLSNPTKWQIPTGSSSETTIAPGGYLIIWADGEPDEGLLHADFQLGKTDGKIGLFATDGVTLVDSVEYDQQVTDKSYGRYPNAGGDWRHYNSPTAGTENLGTAYLGVVADPQFSVGRGFHEDPFDVTLTCSTPGAAIYYTLGNADPTESSTLYTGPVSISSSTTCLRAKTFSTGYLPSASVTHTYIFVDEIANHDNMSTRITNITKWGPEVIKSALLEIPSISLVTSQAIPNTNPDPTQDLWISPPEVPVSIEMIFPDGSNGFQLNAGVERFGRKYTPFEKQALRVSFKNMYGPSRLKFDLFGDTPSGGSNATKSFNQITLRNGSHDSMFYYNSNYPAKGNYVRGRWCYERQIEMGHLSLRGKFVHVYHNGVYVGQYHMFERPTADFMSQYIGGEEEDYDIMKGRGGLVYMEGDFTSSGKLDSWDNMKANIGNWEYVKENIDIDNLIDYLILNFYGGNEHDWYGNHNWVAGRKRGPGGKWMFYMWDNDFLFCRSVTGANTLNNGTPSGLYGSLKQHLEFKVRMGDRAQKHFFNGGMLTPGRVADDFTELYNRIKTTAIPEYARWQLAAHTAPNPYPEVKGHGRYLTPDTLEQSIDSIKFAWAPVRTGVVLTQMRGEGVFPSIDAPSFNQHGGSVQLPFSLVITAPSGTIYYTLDGSDPRAIGGAVAGTLYSGSIPLTNSVIVKTRAKSGSTWSALNEVTFGTGPIAENLRITEIMYHPTDPTPAEKDTAGNQNLIDEDFEFIEVKNTGTVAINLNLAHFTDGIDFTFGDYTLGAGEFAVIVKNQPAFEARYPGVSTSLIAGTYIGALDNGGEEIVLRDALGVEIHDFEYNDTWFAVTDGGGYSLDKIDPDNASNVSPDSWASRPGWRPSSAPNGTPGTEDTYTIELGDIMISEVMTHTDDLDHGDWIEIWNTTDSPINIGGWFLSDDEDTNDPTKLMKYEIATDDDRAWIDAYSYVVFDAVNDFRNPLDEGSHVQFGLSENGEDVYLTSGSGGVLTNYATWQDKFGGAENGVSLGMYVKSDGSDDFVRLESVTKGYANVNDPIIGPVVISEIMYNPSDPDSTAEFIELTNITGSAVPLYDPANPENTWRINNVGDDDVPDNGIGKDEYPLPPGITLSPNETILITRGDPTQFRSTYSIPGGIRIYGSYLGALSNGGEKVTLIQLGTPDPITGDIPKIRIDRVNYDDEAPWPTTIPGVSGPDGEGDSLHRKVLGDYGNDVVNWEAGTPTPGTYE